MSNPAAAPTRPQPWVLAGQKALVTGASSGIGRAVALALGEAGADVAVNYIGSEAEAIEVVDAIRRAGRDAFACAADVSCEDQVEAMFAEMLGRFGTIDILVNNCLLYTSPSPRDLSTSRMPSSA